MFAELHSDINSHKSSLLSFNRPALLEKNRSAKVKDGIINLFLRNNLIGRYTLYFGAFLPNEVAIKSIRNYARKSCYALMLKMLLNLTPYFLEVLQLTSLIIFIVLDTLKARVIEYVVQTKNLLNV